MRTRRINPPLPKRIIVLGVFLGILGLLAAHVVAQEQEQEDEGSQNAEQGQERAKGIAVRLYLTAGTIPEDDPLASEWDTIQASEFDLSPQVHWPTRLLEATVKSVKVRGMHDGTRMAVLMDYQDPTKDLADAAALEFMVGDKKAHFAHGQKMAQVEGGPVNIWYWKNETGKAVDMTAKGFGTLRPQDDGQDVTATGSYQDGRWRVVFSRSLETSDKEQDVQIVPGKWTNIAFAIWDGKLTEAGEPKEKGSQKAITSWWSIRAELPPDTSVFLYAFLGLGIAALFEVALIWKLRKGQAA